tara:strand:- start:480 stop:1277 length:798 start_codon:yes stop_codon:yes gene_type:complete
MVGWEQRRRRKALVRDISPNFTNALANYFGSGPSNINLSKKAHEKYVQALEKHGLDVLVLPSLEHYPDSCFVEDAAVVVDGGVVICNLGHHKRAGESESLISFFEKKMEIIVMPDGATLDGGDVIFFDDMFLIGRSSRTNDLGVEFFRKVCEERGFGTFVFNIPVSTLHLSTVCSSPAPRLLVAAEGHLIPEQFEGLDTEIIWIPNDESYASNIIGFENHSVIISDGYPKTKEIMKKHGFDVTVVDMEHIRAADGSLTCLRIFYG